MRIFFIVLLVVCCLNKVQDWILEKAIDYVLNEPTHKVTIEGGGGFFPFFYSFNKISIDDEKGTWLVLKKGSLSMDSLTSFREVALENLIVKKKPKMYYLQDIPWKRIADTLTSREMLKTFKIQAINILDFKTVNFNIKNQNQQRILSASSRDFRLIVDEKHKWTMSAPDLLLQGSGIKFCRAHIYSYGYLDISFQPLDQKIFIKNKNISASATLLGLSDVQNIDVRYGDFFLKGDWKGVFSGYLGYKDSTFQCLLRPDLFFFFQNLFSDKKHNLKLLPSKIENVFGADINISDFVEWNDIKMTLQNKKIKIQKKDKTVAHGFFNQRELRLDVLDLFKVFYQNHMLKIFLPHFSYGPFSVTNLKTENENIFVEKITINDLKVHNLKGGLDLQKPSFKLDSKELSFLLGKNNLFNLTIPQFKWKATKDGLKVGKGTINLAKENILLKSVPLKRLLFLKNYPDLKHISGYIGLKKSDLVINKTWGISWDEKGFAIKASPSFCLVGKWDKTFHAKGDLNLSNLLLPFDVRGIAMFHLSGALDDYKGYISVKDGAYENVNSNILVEKINGYLVAQGKWLILKDVRAKNIAAAGKISKDDVDIALDLKEYLPIDTDEIYLKTKGHIEVKGPWPHLKVKGGVEVLKGEVFLENLITPEVATLKTKKPEVKKVSTNAENQYDLSLRSERYIEINGLGLKSFWRPQMAVRGGFFNPYLIGELQLKKGHLIVFGKQMALLNGKIKYKEKDKNVPHIDLLAKRDVKDIKIFLHINGSAKNPKVTLTSIPSCTEDVVLAYLLFEKDIKNAGVTECLELAKILVLKEKNGLDFIKNIQDRLGFVNIEIKEEEEISNDLSIKKKNFVEVSKEFGKIKLGASQEVGDTKETRGSIKFPITSNLSVEAGISARSSNEHGRDFTQNLGLDFQYRF
jgi:hypothetical protein